MLSLFSSTVFLSYVCAHYAILSDFFIERLLFRIIKKKTTAHSLQIYTHISSSAVVFRYIYKRYLVYFYLYEHKSQFKCTFTNKAL